MAKLFVLHRQRQKATHLVIGPFATIYQAVHWLTICGNHGVITAAQVDSAHDRPFIDDTIIADCRAISDRSNRW